MVRLRLRTGFCRDRRLEDGLRPSVIAAIGRLEIGATLEDLSTTLAGWDERAQLDFTLDRLCTIGALTWTVMLGSEELATLEPDRAAPAPPADPDQCRHEQHRLSPLAYVRTVRGQLVLQSPRSHYRMLFHDARAFELLHHLHSKERRGTSPLPEAAANSLIALLCRAGFLDAGGDADETDDALAHWDFHELLFHMRSRQAPRERPSGAGPGSNDNRTPPPAVVPTAEDGAIPLFRPDLEMLAADDASLTEVIETRRSIRSYDGEPLTAAQLGEFLYRTARVRKLRVGSLGEVCDKPYPSGGARHALEIYPAVRHCEGLEPGLYRYDALGHRLHRVREFDASVASLVLQGTPDSSSPAQPPVLLVIAARFQRVQWAYHSHAYALILKDTGVLMQTMYLVATAMGLSPCAVGYGDAGLFAACAGTQLETESSVGEFALGGVPRERDTRW